MNTVEKPQVCSLLMIHCFIVVKNVDDQRSEESKYISMNKTSLREAEKGNCELLKSNKRLIKEERYTTVVMASPASILFYQFSHATLSKWHLDKQTFHLKVCSCAAFQSSATGCTFCAFQHIPLTSFFLTLTLPSIYTLSHISLTKHDKKIGGKWRRSIPGFPLSRKQTSKYSETYRHLVAISVHYAWKREIVLRNAWMEGHLLNVTREESW